jgi:hypothetical protein
MRIGCTPYLGAQRLQAFLGACYAHAQDLDVEVFHLTSAVQRRRLRRDELDLGLIDPHDVDADRGVETQPLFPGDQLALFLPIQHSLAAYERLDPRAVAAQTLLTRPRAMDPDFHETLMSRIARAGYRFAEVRERGGADPRDVLFAVAEGRGVTIGPLSLRMAAGDIGALVCARPLHPPQAMPDTRVAWRADPSARLRHRLAVIRPLAAGLHAEATACAATPPAQDLPGAVAEASGISFLAAHVALRRDRPHGGSSVAGTGRRPLSRR